MRISELFIIAAHLPVHSMWLPHPDLPNDPEDVHSSLRFQTLKEIGYRTECRRATCGATVHGWEEHGEVEYWVERVGMHSRWDCG